MLYLWMKALHIMAWASWMAGLFYLPRLFVYHAERAAPGTEASEIFKVMEHKLMYVIMRPAMLVTWATGLYLAFFAGVIDWSYDFWMHAKLLLVVLMTGAHHMMIKWMKGFKADENAKSGRFYRIMNEVPTLLFIFVVILVIVRPF
jgi:putative membrane protein